MTKFIDVIRQGFRFVMRKVAGVLNRLSGGRLTPDTVTIIGCIMHVPIGVLIATGHWISAAILLIIFGLFDTLDGELARLQKRVSDTGGLLDASTDRFKEVILYAGAAYWISASASPRFAVWAVVACGASLCVSYIKSKGETMIAAKGGKRSYSELNKIFSDGLVPFEVRMFLLIVGLLSGQLLLMVIIIAVLASYTALWRLVRVTRALLAHD